jgi:hypothetical protein
VIGNFLEGQTTVFDWIDSSYVHQEESSKENVLVLGSEGMESVCLTGIADKRRWSKGRK